MAIRVAAKEGQVHSMSKAAAIADSNREEPSFMQDLFISKGYRHYEAPVTVGLVHPPYQVQGTESLTNRADELLGAVIEAATGQSYAVRAQPWIRLLIEYQRT
jgi:hypothetical protein